MTYSSGRKAAPLTRLIGRAFPMGWIELDLTDGRRLRVPVRQFPGIQRLSLRHRQQW